MRQSATFYLAVNNMHQGNIDQALAMFKQVCVCVCEWEKEREREKKWKREKEWEVIKIIMTVSNWFCTDDLFQTEYEGEDPLRLLPHRRDLSKAGPRGEDKPGSMKYDTYFCILNLSKKKAEKQIRKIYKTTARTIGSYTP